MAAGFNIFENFQDAFNECISREFSSEVYWAFHHLTVPAYNFQHPAKLSKQGWVTTRKLLHEFLIKGKSPQRIRNIYGKQVENQNRDWKITRTIGKENNINICWSKTILNIRFANPNEYCADLIDWADIVLKESAECYTQ